jgi:hypothetical protein
LISPVYFADLPELAPYTLSTTAGHSQPPSERYRVVVAQSQLLASLVLKVEDELGIFAVLVCEHVFALEDRGIELGTTEGCEDFTNGGFDVCTARCLCRAIVPCSLVQIAV